MVSNVAASAASFQVLPILVRGAERYLSFLPLAHQMERVVQALMIAWGARIGFSRGDPALIMEDIALLRPTFFATVPRLLNRLHDGIRTKANAAGGIKTKLFFHAMDVKLQDLKDYHHLTHPIWDKIVFNKIKKQLGFEDCRLVITGSAPVAPRVLDFLRCILGCRVMEGYGQTETTCTATMTYPLHAGGDEERPSHVGGPISTCEIKLQSVPEMQYLVTDRLHDDRIPVVGRGEVLIRGPSLMKGYFSLPEKTAQTIDKDGWLHTGDVGAWLEDGTLCIVDRANNIFKTALGEYIQPEKIERAICRVPAIATAFVFGTTLNARLVAIVVLNPEALPQFCKQRNINQNDMAALKKELTAAVKSACQEANLFGYEIPAALSLQTKPFTIESGVLTATSKLVRGVAKQFFKNEIVELYKEIGEQVAL
jgi:long-chain acyl-CoA synthetase